MILSHAVSAKIGIVVILLSTYVAQSQSLRLYPKSRVDSTKTLPAEGIRVLFAKEVGDEKVYTFVKPDSTIWFGPSIGLDFFVRESKSGSYRAGFIPGLGYGIKYKPESWKSGYLWGLDLFIQGSLADEIEDHPGNDFFNIDFLPVLSFLNWVGVGIGPRFKIGLEGQKSTTRLLFSFGLKKSI